MQPSDAHLERALAEYNDRISELEDGPLSAELVDALQKRGKVLSLMGYSTSSAEDFEDAADYLEELDRGFGASADLHVRVYAALGSVYKVSEPDTMWDIYHKILDYIPALENPSQCARTCLRCAEDLAETGMTDDCDALLEVAFKAKGSEDMNGRNVYFESLLLSAALRMEDRQYSKAAVKLNDAAKVGAELYEKGDLYEHGPYAFCLLNLCDCLMEMDDREASRVNLEILSSLLDDQEFTNDIDSEDLADLHGGVGKTLMELGDVKEAEKHLLRQAAFSLNGDDEILREAINQKANGKN